MRVFLVSAIVVAISTVTAWAQDAPAPSANLPPGPAPALAGRDMGTADRMRACAATLDNLARLTCFDRIAADLKGGSQKPELTAPLLPAGDGAGRSCFMFNGERVCENGAAAAQKPAPIVHRIASNKPNHWRRAVRHARHHCR